MIDEDDIYYDAGWERWTTAQDAWVVHEWTIGGRTQLEIGEQLKVSNATICIRIKKFGERFSGQKFSQVYDQKRKRMVEQALRKFLSMGGFLSYPLWTKNDFTGSQWSTARGEHATMCRAENETWKMIGRRLGVGKERARQIQMKFARKMSWAMRKMSVSIR